MGNRPILVTGCQRSGTTLLSLILDSHADATVVDEWDFDIDELPRYLSASEYSPQVVFKLPRQAHDVEFMRSLPDVRVLWCVRDPRDVVASMVGLHLSLGDAGSAPWAAHPGGATFEIESGYPALPAATRAALETVHADWVRSQARPPASRSRQEIVLAGALCWRIKQEWMSVVASSGIPLRPVGYEDLVTEPRRVVGEVLHELGLAWDDNVLRHHELHSGEAIGGTMRDRPIDESNRGTWKRLLGESDLAIVRGLNRELARSRGYEI